MDTPLGASTGLTATDEAARDTGCQICGDRTPPERYVLREMLFGTRESFEYRRCAGCGVMQIVDPPADMAPYYPPDYYDFGDESAPAPRLGPLASLADRWRNQVALFGTGRWRARRVRRWVPAPPPEVKREAPFVKAARLRSFDDPILDVGCGRRARNLVRLKRAGFRKLVGVDPFLEHDETIEGISLRRRSIHEAAKTLRPRSFRVVTFHHSFEHVIDPSETLTSAARLLQPEGTIVIRTPVMGTGLWEAFGTSWWELDAPRHLFVHTTASLERLADEVGLKVAAVTWESSFVEFVASDQIARDIAWREPASYYVHPPGDYDEGAIDDFKRRAAELNAAGRAGRAAFYLRRIGDDASV